MAYTTLPCARRISPGMWQSCPPSQSSFTKTRSGRPRNAFPKTRAVLQQSRGSAIICRMRPAKHGVGRPSILGNASAEARMVAYTPAITHPPVREDASQEPHLLFSSDSGVELIYPSRLVSPAPWIGHIPFALWLVEALRPQVVVELGV